ncbi:MAG: hypothetical protein IKA03_00545, partial [Alphaproteobacteria bacterium]|nr:hypothetical protein [Alphaproteobacteria bacterium]
MNKLKLLMMLSIIIGNLSINTNCQAQIKADIIKAGSKVESALEKTIAQCQSVIEGIQGSQFGQFVGDGVKYAKQGIVYAKSAYEQGMQYANKTKEKVLNSKEYKAAMISKEIANETSMLKELGEELIEKQEEIRQEYELQKEQTAAKQKLIQQNNQIIDTELNKEDVSGDGNKKNVSSDNSALKTDRDSLIATIKKDPITIVQEAIRSSLDGYEETSTNKEENDLDNGAYVIENESNSFKDEAIATKDNPKAESEKKSVIYEADGPDAEQPQPDTSVKKNSVQEKINFRKKFKMSYLHNSETLVFAKAEGEEDNLASLIRQAYDNQGISPSFMSAKDEIAALQQLNNNLEIQMTEKIAEMAEEYAPKIAAQTRKIVKKEKELEGLYGKNDKKKEDKKPEEAQKENANKFFSIIKDPKATIGAAIATTELSLKKKREAKEKQAEYVAEESSNDFSRVAGIRQEMTSHSEEVDNTSQTAGTMPGESENAGVNTEVLAKQLMVLQNYINLMIADLQIQTTFALKTLKQEAISEPKGVFNLCDYTDPSNVM